MTLFKVPANEIRKEVDPLDGSVWMNGPINKKDIDAIIDSGIKENRSWDADNLVSTLKGDEAKKFHIERIATLLQELDKHEPPTMKAELHNDSDIRINIVDGNHRLAAYFIRGDKEIPINIITYDEKDIPKKFPGAKPIKM